jgi:hypothetical protein
MRLRSVVTPLSLYRNCWIVVTVEKLLLASKTRAGFTVTALETVNNQCF